MKLNDNLILFEGRTNILLFISNNNAYLIDTGNNKEMVDKVIKYLEDNNLNLKYIINTHSHVDHTKYNYYLHKLIKDIFIFLCSTWNIKNIVLNFYLLFFKM